MIPSASSGSHIVYERVLTRPFRTSVHDLERGAVMRSRERVISAIHHQTSDRVPLDGYFRQDVWATLEDHFGTQDAEEIRRELGLDIRYTMLEPSASFVEQAAPAPWQIPEIGVGKDNLVITRDNGWLEDEYGICRIPNDNGTYWLYSHHPLAEADIEGVRRYRFPDPTLPERYEDVRADVARWGDEYFTVAELWNLFKSSWELRGFEQYMMDLCMDPLLVETLADRFLEHRIEQSRRLVRCGIDMIVIMGDIAMQNTMMLSPKMWREYFKPRLKTWIEEMRRERDVYFMFHSDGNMEAVCEDLIEVGFDVINPIQPESMDVEKIKSEYGDRVCLHGTISLQKTLPFGTPEDVADEVRHRVSVCARGGGLILSPSNTIQPDVSVENILTLYNTAKELRVESR
jgi:uroporphyrinogen decarboxylase